MKHNNELSPLVAAIIGICLSLLISIFAALGVSSMIGKEAIETSGSWMNCLIWCVSVLCGVMVGSALSTAQKIIMSAIISAGYLIIMCGTGILFFNDGFYKIGIGFLSVLAAFGITTGLQFWKGRGKSGTKRYKYRP